MKTEEKATKRLMLHDRSHDGYLKEKILNATETITASDRTYNLEWCPLCQKRTIHTYFSLVSTSTLLIHRPGKTDTYLDINSYVSCAGCEKREGKETWLQIKVKKTEAEKRKENGRGKDRGKTFWTLLPNTIEIPLSLLRIDKGGKKLDFFTLWRIRIKNFFIRLKKFFHG